MHHGFVRYSAMFVPKLCLSFGDVTCPIALTLIGSWDDFSFPAENSVAEMYAGPEVCSSIHARHRKSVHEVRACIAARIRDADKEGDGRSPRAGNLESVVVARQSRILAPRKPVDRSEERRVGKECRSRW